MKHKLIIWIFLCVIFLMCLFTGWIIKQASGSNTPPAKTIVLCFDDGPRPAVIKKLLSTLETYNVKAAFFVEGAIAATNKELIKKMHKAGHEIENHSWGHENFIKLHNREGLYAISDSLLRTEVTIFNATGRKPKFFRPPFWEINNEIEKIIKGWGYTIMKLGNPDINTEDYVDASKNRPPEILVERVKKIIADRERQNIFNHVLVFHELHITAEALKTLIPYFQAQGYKFVPLETNYRR